MKKRIAIMLCLILLAMPLGLRASAADEPAVIWPTEEFVTGCRPWWVSPLLLSASYIPRSVPQLGFRQHSLLILHEGRLVHESYRRGYDAETPHVAFSVTKSVLTALVGVAIAQGYIEGVEQYVIEFFPDATIAPGQEQKRGMTIKHLLLMRSGLPTDMDSFEAEDAGLAAFESPQVRAPGARFRYCSGAGTQTLVGVIERATEQNLLDFATEHLFAPIGITSVEWNTTESGSPVGGFGIYMTPRDMLRFGYLFLRGGEWDGQRILPEGWVEASRPPVAINPLSYGYMWWGNVWSPLLGRSFEARGFRGQFVTVFPARDLVVVRTGGGF